MWRIMRNVPDGWLSPAPISFVSDSGPTYKETRPDGSLDESALPHNAPWLLYAQPGVCHARSCELSRPGFRRAPPEEPLRTSVSSGKQALLGKEALPRARPLRPRAAVDGVRVAPVRAESARPHPGTRPQSPSNVDGVKVARNRAATALPHPILDPNKHSRRLRSRATPRQLRHRLFFL